MTETVPRYLFYEHKKISIFFPSNCKSKTSISYIINIFVQVQFIFIT